MPGLGDERPHLSARAVGGAAPRDPLSELGKIAVRAVAIGLMAASLIITAHTGMVLLQKWHYGWQPLPENATPSRAKSLQ